MIKRILLIGHKSFVGKKIKEYLQKDSIFNICILENYFNEKDIFFLDKEKFCEKYLNKYENIDIIITCLHIHKNKFQEEFNLNIKVYENIIYYAKSKKVDKIIYMSSVNVSEDRNSSYAHVKYKIEEIIENFKNFVIVRPSTIITLENNKLIGGKNGRSFSLFEKFFKYNLPIPIIGNGKYLFTFCFLNDLSNFILLVLNDKMFLNKKINFFSGEHLNFDEFIDIISKIKKKKVFKIFIPMFLINFLCKIKIFNYKNVDNLINQRIDYDYFELIKNKMKLNQIIEKIN